MKKKPLIIIIASAVAVASIGVTVFFIVKNNNDKSQTQTVIDTVSFGKANYSSTPSGGSYLNTTTVKTSDGSQVVAVNTTTVDLTNREGIALLDGTNNLVFKKQDKYMYFQQVDEITMTFTSESNGSLALYRYKNEFDSSTVTYTVTNGVLNKKIDSKGYRRFDFEASDGTLEITSISFSYKYYSSYVDPLETNNFVDIYSSNDFHGYVQESSAGAGLGKFTTYFKEKGKNGDTLLIDVGDTWQGTVYSNMNYGALVNNAMAYAEFDARVVGNHDFDWGLDALKANTARVFTYQGKDYKVPTLAANVYDYDFDQKKFGSNQMSDIGQKTFTYTLENGVKIGIVGVIGESQITTISSLYTHDIGFKPHIPIIKEEATNLRNSGCDIVIVAIHGGQEDVLGNGLENYVDLVLCGHTHRTEDQIENGLLYFQGGRYGDNFGHIRLTQNKSSKKINYDFEYITGSAIKRAVKTVDPVIKGLIDEEVAKCDDISSEVVATGVNGYFANDDEGPNMVAQAMFDYATQVDGINDIQFTYVNNTRSGLRYGTWTYADIYQALPFDNTVYVAEITGKEVRDEIGAYNWIYRNPSFNGVVDKTKKYKVAIIDYLFFHTNERRYYNYFPETNGVYSTVLSANYREITKWWLKEYKHYDLNANSIYSSDFESTQSKHSKDFTYINF